jgi:hypothetical protein
MDRKNAFEKLKAAVPAKFAKWGVFAIILTGLGFAYGTGFFHSKKPAAQAATQAAVEKAEKAEAAVVAHKAATHEPHGIVETYKAAFDSTQEKVAEVQRALEENERLRYENANLRLKLETVQFDCHEKEAVVDTQKIGAKVADEAGSRVARTLASIAYKAPGNLLPNQLYTLGVTYFKAHEDEKAAVIFSFLTNLEENAAYKNARNFLMTGVAWYRVDNLEMADMYFEKTMKEPEVEGNLQFQAQARLWKGLIAQHKNNEKETQYWLKDLVDHHPHSLEATWINGKEAAEVEREPSNSEE